MAAVNRANPPVSLQPTDADEGTGTALAHDALGTLINGELHLTIPLPRVRVMLVAPAVLLAFAMPVAPAAGDAAAVGAT